MKRLLSWLLNPWLLAALGLLALSLVIWYVGPYIAIAGFVPLASETVRWVLIGLVLATYVTVKVIGALRARRTNQRVPPAEASRAGQLAGADR